MKNIYTIILFLVLCSPLFCQNNKDAIKINKDSISTDNDSLRLQRYSSSSMEVALPQIVPASPEAAAIAKYVNYPADYYTGLPKIEIPLYEVVVGNLRLPITLSYHASGFKPLELDGWIGQGWTLNVEPSISRSIKGIADEYPNGYLNNNNIGNINNLDYKLGLVSGNYDEQPDEFFYRLLGKSGSFYWQRPPNGSLRAVTNPYEPLIINQDVNGFTIVDETGVNYSFKTWDAEITGHIVTDPPTCWKGSDIASPDGQDVIYFAYENSKDYYYDWDNRITVVDHTQSAYVEGVYSTCSQFYYVGAPTSPQEPSCNPMGNPAANVKEIHTKKLKTITFKGGSVTFTNSLDGNGATKLDKITVKNDNGEIIKYIEFKRSQSNNNGCWRSVLNEVVIGNSTQYRKNEIYSFEYEGYNFPPFKYTKDIDHWGFYNGAGNDIRMSLTPAMDIEMINPGYNGGTPFTHRVGHANRNANIGTMMMGILTKVIQPTGGETSFQYEINKYLDDNNQVVEGGGLRIRIITEQDGSTGSVIHRAFRYGEDGNGLGFARYKITDNDYIATQWEDQPGYSSQRRRTIYSNSPANLFYSNGVAVVYDKVKEYITPYDGYDPVEYPQGPGCTEYKFQAGNSLPWKVEGTFFYVNPQQDWMDGQLIEKKSFDYYGNLVSTSQYTYSTYYKDMATGAIAYIPIMPTGSSGISVSDIDYFNYQYYSGVKKITSETTTELRGSGSVTTQKNYDYNRNASYMAPVSITTRIDNIQTNVEEFKYTLDVTSGLSGDALTARNLLASRNQLTELLEYNTGIGGNYQTKYTEYGIFNGNAYPARVKTKIGYDGLLETRINFHDYNTQGNPISVSYQNGVKTIYIWGYKGRYPLAQIVNAEYSDITRYISASTLNSIAAKAYPTASDFTTINNLRNNLTNAQVTTYQYKLLVGVSQMTSPNGLTTYYSYDHLGRLTESYFMEGSSKRVIESYNYNYGDRP